MESSDKPVHAADEGQRPARPEPTVVGIGASAGGLAALKTFFHHVPEDSGLAFVVVVHLSPQHESHLAELLQPHVRIPVEQVTETVPLEANHVYVIPPGANLSTIDTHLRLSDLEERRRHRAPIDHFFRTLAETHDGHAVAIVLTGTGSDGALGLREVKQKGGLTIAQDPNEAEYDGMPQSAIATGLVDAVLPLAEMVGTVLRFARTEPRLAVPGAEEELPNGEHRLLQKIFAQVRARTGRDFGRYKRSTILRRIRRRMQLRYVEELPAYLEILREDPAEVQALSDDFLITVTNFFRDQEVFEHLEAEVIPKLFEDKGPDDAIRVWSVGCATGEEAYSLAILLLEACRRREEPPPRVQVFASDLHERSLAKAREGFYPGDIAANVSEERLHRFFETQEGGYRIKKEVRDLVVFAPHNLLGDPPFSKLDLITCRNLLIYLQRRVQDDVTALFHYALNPGGYLLLGTSETVDRSDLFHLESKTHCLYRRRSVSSHMLDPRLPVFRTYAKRYEASGYEGAAPTGEPVRYGRLHQRLVERYGPPSLLVSSGGEVVHLSEEAGRYLVHPGGEITTSVFKLVREELRIELRTALYTARQRREPVRTKPVLVRFGDAERLVALHVRPATEPAEEDYALVFFEEYAPEEAPRRSAPDEGEGATTRELAAELELTKERLQTIIEEYEASQEEMKASNEELQSSNEELRSTMEELETSKEELQSMNEELQTVSQENRHKVDELGRLSSDLQNLLSSTDIATLFLDRELRILRFTPRASELYNVRGVDRGRPLGDLTHRLSHDDLDADAREVLKTLVPVEREVEDQDGRWFLTRVLPYRSADDRIEGVVITFVDITEQKRAEAALRESEARFRAVADLVPDLLWRSDPSGHTTWFNRRWMEFTGQTAEEAEGWGWTAALHPDDREQTTATFRRAVEQAEPAAQEHRLRRRDGTYRWFLARIVPVRDDDGAVQHWYGTATDVHEQRTARQTLEERVQERTAQVRDLAAHLTMAEQEERRRISRILHDDLQQLLYGIDMKLSMLRRGALEPENLAEARGWIRRAIDMARQLTVDLSPPVLQQEGLVEALRWLQHQMRELHGLEVHLDTTHQGRFADEDLRVLLFQIVRELLFNVKKHAEVGEARVRIEVTDQEVVIHVEDEGRGFDVEAVEAAGRGTGGGFGLFSARERLRLLGGALAFRSQPGEGVHVELRAPLRPDRPQD